MTDYAALKSAVIALLNDNSAELDDYVPTAVRLAETSIFQSLPGLEAFKTETAKTFTTTDGTFELDTDAEAAAAEMVRSVELEWSIASDPGVRSLTDANTNVDIQSGSLSATINPIDVSNLAVDIFNVSLTTTVSGETMTATNFGTIDLTNSMSQSITTTINYPSPVSRGFTWTLTYNPGTARVAVQVATATPPSVDFRISSATITMIAGNPTATSLLERRTDDFFSMLSSASGDPLYYNVLSRRAGSVKFRISPYVSGRSYTATVKGIGETEQLDSTDNTSATWLSKYAFDCLLYGTAVHCQVFRKGDPAAYLSAFQNCLAQLKSQQEMQTETEESQGAAS